jgi:short-subunit dehydrogenase
MIGLNVMALVALTHRYLEGMRRRKRGTIINVSSTASFQPIPYMATYAATKAFVTSFSEALAEENRAYGIQVLNLCPGATSTNFFNAAKIRDPLTVKGMQTAEQVVEAAMRGMAAKKSRVISGWTNYAAAHIATFAPNALVTRVMGKVLRPKVVKKK